MTPLDLDPHAHTPWRRIMSGLANGTTPAKLEARITDEVNEVIDAFAADIPLRAICIAMGVDTEYRVEFLERSLALLQALTEPERHARLAAEFAGLMLQMVEERRGRADQHRGTEYIDILADATIDGRPLTPDELCVALINPIPPGFETTISGLSRCCTRCCPTPRCAGG